MKNQYKKTMRQLLVSIYTPIITRIELLRSTRMWQKGIKATLSKYKEGGAPRFYMLFDQSHKDWAIMTYDPNRKQLLSYRRLVQLGKWKATGYFHNVEEIKAASYYYTPSKWGAIGCDADNKVRANKLRQWQSYYMWRVSVPMQKLRAYKKKYGLH